MSIFKRIFTIILEFHLWRHLIKSTIINSLILLQIFQFFFNKESEK